MESKFFSYDHVKSFLTPFNKKQFGPIWNLKDSYFHLQTHRHVLECKTKQLRFITKIRMEFINNENISISSYFFAHV
jgi:hypothetical protein